ncbi:amino acid adenylation domain-containing protein [Kordia sp.]|uniref:amino acid adenylation domain-containing protein n=1 Tax=Kordia sp. TaxID=1965332 RepID=UPI003B5CA0CA
MIKNVKDLLSLLREHDIKLSLKDENLEVKSYTKKIPSDLIQEIKSNKEGLITYLKGKENTNQNTIPLAKTAANYPLSAPQKRLWIISQYEEMASAYNIFDYKILEKGSSIQSFIKAVEAVIDRHEILRSVFKQDETGEVKQWILDRKEIDFQIKTIDLSDAENPMQRLQSFTDNDVQQSFNLENGPLLRVHFLKIATDTYAFHYCMHHIICDGWSKNVLTSDVLAYYNSFENKQAVALPELRIQYKDYATWNHNNLITKKYESHKQYWLEKLSGEIPVLDLPSQKQRPKIMTTSGKKLRSFIPLEVVDNLKTFCSQQEGSLFTGILSVWKLLLYRYTSQENLIIGTALLDRADDELKNQIGFYVNTLVLKNKIDPTENFNTLYQKIKQSLLVDFDHQEYPFDELLGELNVSRDVGRNALFDVLLTMQNISKEEQVVSTNEIINMGATRARFDIEVNIVESQSGLTIDLIYNEDVYEQALIIQFMEHFEVLMKNVLKNPVISVAEISMLATNEEKTITETFQGNTKVFEENIAFINTFQKIVETQPKKVVAIFEGESLTYEELHQKSNQLANNLLSLGLGKGSLIPLCIERSFEMLIGVLGILKTGAAYVPIGTDYPTERIDFILQEIEAKFILTTAEVSKNLTINKDIISLDLKAAESYATSSENLAVTLNENDVAYVIYTSGTTGKPKGVLNAYAGLMNRLYWMRDQLNVDENSILIQKTPYTFDVSVWELLLPLITGSTLVFSKPAGHKDPFYLQELIIKEKVSIIHFVPSMLAAFLESFSEDNLSNLQHVVCSGEALMPNTVSRFKEKLPSVNIHNYYGPTEAAIDVTAINLTNIDTTQQVSIGYPVPNTRIYIVNSYMQIQPIGVAGELLIGGIQVAKRYLNREELTKEKFIQSPFDIKEKLYRTGDLASWNSDGSIKYHGRIDNQVKIRGYRIELGEIEQLLTAQEEILNAVVIANKTDDSQTLIAYIVSEKEIDRADIKSKLLQKLPAYMMPSIYVQLKEIPLNTNGKLDKKKLPIPSEQAEIQEEYIAPTTTEEKNLAEVLQVVLKHEKIGRRSNFYNMGGDSIKSILVVSKLKQKGYKLKVDDILRNPVLEDLAKLMHTNTHVVDQKEVTGNVALTPTQHYFFETSTIKNIQHFNQSVILRSDQRIDLDVLKKSLKILIAHHDALRMRFTFTDGTWQQYNQDNTAEHFTINSYDLQEVENPLKDIEIIGNVLQSSFDIEATPLVNVAHFTLKDSDRVAFIIHHLVVDGVSWRIFLEDFTNVYQQILNQKTIEIPEKTNAFQDWAASLKTYAKSDKSESERNYWEEVQNQFIVPIPKEIVAEEAVDYKTYETQFTLNKQLTTVLQTKFHGIYKTNNNDILLTALGLAVRDIYGLETCVLEMEGHGREEIIENMDISRTIGWFTSMYPFVLNVSNTKTSREALVQVKEDLRKLPNKGMGYGILKYLNEDFQLELEPSIVFNFLGDFGENAGDDQQKSIFNYAGESIGSNIAAENEETYLLEVSGMIVEGKLQMAIKFSEVHYDKDTIIALKEAYEQHLVTLIEDIGKETKNYLTPSDVIYKGLIYKTLEKLNADGNVEDIYQLSPMQESIYFQSIAEKNMQTYFEQATYRMHVVDLDIELIQNAYEKLIARHAILRTKFITVNDTPLQIVCKDVPAKFTYEEIKDNTSQKAVQKKLEAINKRIFEKNFQLGDPSQMSLYVIKTSKATYEFIWNYHHILMDGWCMNILLNDFIEILKASSSESEIALDTPVPFSDYIQWLNKIDKQEMVQYWENYLQGVDQVAEVPYKLAKKNEKDFEEKKIEFEIREDKLKKLHQFCSKLNITTNTFFQGAWGILLAKCCNTNDVTFGSVVSGRSEEVARVDEIIGLFSNTIPVRVNFDKEEKVEKYLKSLNEKYIAGKNHHYLSLAEIQSKSELGNNLINHLLVFQNFYAEEVDAIPEVEVETQESANGIHVEMISEKDQPKFDFDIKVFPKDTSIRVAFRYNELAYDTDGIESLLVRFEEFIDTLMNASGKSIKELKIISDAEEHQIFHTFNKPSKTLTNSATIVDMFSDQVNKTPHQEALVFEDKTYTYQELDTLTNQLANYLKEKEVITGEKVGIYLGRSDWMMISILGILKAGAAYVPINTELGEDSKIHIVEDAAIKTIVSISENIFDLEFFTGTPLLIDIDFEANEYDSKLIKVKDASKNDAYIIYTSGSTGKPKGVLIGHGSLASSTRVRNQYYEKVKSYLLIPSFSFDSSIAIIWQALTTGAALHVVSETTVKNAEKLSALIHQYQIESLLCVPSLYNVLLTIGSQRITSLKRIVVAGEKLTEKLVEKHFEVLNTCKLYNEYGPTENTVWASVAEVKAEKLNTDIGTSIDRSQIYIVDNDFNLMPLGVAGELVIGGSHLAKKYINNEDLTAQKFVQNPFNTKERLYRTGDYGKMNVDGTIEFLGRNDEQVKIRGYRVELGEVETALAAKKEITQTVVLTRKINDELVLIAFLVSDNVLQLTELRNYLKGKIPNYMIPSYFVQLDTIPLTYNGKIDRKALLEMDEKSLSNITDFEPAETEEEKILVNILLEIINIESIGMNDDFFAIGGNSLHIMMLVSRLEKEGFHLEVADAIEEPRIGNIAANISKIITE